MKTTLLQLVLMLTASIPGCSQNSDTNPKQEYAFSSTPSWRDEFDYTGAPDPAKWSYDLGDHGWGNHELENYTNSRENSRVENGMLIIEARKGASGKQNYSSARLVTKGKGDFKYGKFEIRAKLPKGRGTWPAIWMLASTGDYGNHGWPDNGEIDIMEHVGFDQNNIHGNIHTKAFNHTIHTNKGSNVIVETASSDFHIYSCEWTPDRVSILVDGKEYFVFKKEAGYTWAEWPFDKPLHLLLNIAVGGDWGGQKGVDDTVFPQKMEVDYVRVFPLSPKK